MTDNKKPPEGDTGPGSMAAIGDARVLDLSTGISGPFGARLLGDYGADVIRIESPAGDPTRSMPPVVQAAPVGEGSLMFQYLNWNKRGIVLDLANPATHADLRKLVEASDVVIESFAPGQLAAWGLSAQTLLEWNPRLVVVSVTDFGQEGPYAQYKGSDLVHQAMSGIMQISGRSDRAPLKHGLNQTAFAGGLNTAYAALAALLSARADGVGEHVDLSTHECCVSELVMSETYYSFMGAIASRRLPVQDPYAGGPIATRDGFIAIQSGGPSPLEGYADVFGDERFREQRFVNAVQRTANVADFRALVEEAASDKSAKALFLEGSKRRMLMGLVQGAKELLACEQLAAREFIQAVEHPATGAHRFPVEMAKLSATPMRVRRRAPSLGEHQAQVNAQLLSSQKSNAAAKRSAAPPAKNPRLPLAGLRVIDLSTVVAVPYMAALLGDLGAEVIKVESPAKLDQTRRGVFTTYLDDDRTPDAVNRSGIWMVLNRNKKSIVLDMASDAGRDVFRDMVKHADIVLDNFTPRVMRGWGLAYEDVRKLQPKIIMLSNTGYGSTGPWSGFPSQGTTLEATMGISAFTGYRGEQPSKAGQSYPDFIACWTGLTAVLAALHHLRRTGEGQWIDLGMYQIGAALVPEALLQYQVAGTEPGRIGNEHEQFVPSNLYAAKGEDQWLALTVETDAQWRALCGAMGRAELAEDNRFATRESRVEHREEVDRIVGAWAAQQEPHAAMHRLQSLGIASGPVLNNRDLLTDPHLLARGFYERVQHNAPIGVRPMMSRPHQWTNRELRVQRCGPEYGEHTREVLREVAGYDDAKIDALFDAKTVRDCPADMRPPDSMGLAGLMRLRALSEHDPDYMQKLGLK